MFFEPVIFYLSEAGDVGDGTEEELERVKGLKEKALDEKLAEIKRIKAELDELLKT